MSGKHDNVGARNDDFARYDRVDKRQSYRLTESADDVFDEDYEIRTCDIAPVLAGGDREREAFAGELGAALEEIGFAILVGHGVSPELHEEVERVVEDLFTRHSLDEKLAFRARRHGAVNQGYFPIEETTDIHPDLVEGWVLCRRAFDLDGTGAVPLADFWPAPEYERALRALLSAQEPLILPIMQSVLTYLGCAPHLYDERLRATNVALRLNYYPPITPELGADGAGRLLGHEDTDLFTLLPAPRSEGLQVLDRRTFRWIRLDAPRGAIVLNTGDYMQRITNDRLPSTTHRVSRPRDPALAGRPRVSFPMNVYLGEDEWLEVLPGLGPARYAPIRAEAFHTQTTAKYYGDDYALPE